MTNCNANATNSIAKPTNSTAKPTNSIAKPTNSIANGTNSIAKATNSIAKTCNKGSLEKITCTSCFIVVCIYACNKIIRCSSDVNIKQEAFPTRRLSYSFLVRPPCYGSHVKCVNPSASMMGLMTSEVLMD